MPISRLLPALSRHASLALTSVAALVLAAPATSALAQPSPALDRVSVWLGGYRATVDGTLSLTSEGLGSTGEQRILDTEDTVKRARLDFLIMDSQGFSIDYYRISSQQDRRVSEAFTYGGTTYGLDADVSSDTLIDLGNVSYRWWMGSGSSTFGLGVGAAYYRLDSTLSAQASLAGSTFQGIERTNESGWAPLLTLGWRTQINDQFRVYADLSGSRKNGDSLSGDIINAALGLEWFPWKNVGVGAEYAGTRVHLKRDEGGDQARLKVKLHGPAVYLRLRF